MAKNRIDVHQHVLPAFWVEGLRQKKSAHRPPAWSPELAIAYMDSREIAKGILSLTAPGLSAWADNELCDAARRVNEYTADLVTKWQGRFGNFATLPLPDMEGALIEARFALDALNAEGIVLLSSYADRFLGDPFFEPLWQELDSRGTVVFIHPTGTALPPLPGIPPPVVDFPFATTRTAVDMVLNGVLDRYTNMRVILSHAGGFLPYAAYRFATCAQGAAGAPIDAAQTDALIATFRRFYFDTALSSSPASIAGLKEFADPARILFGSDFPYAPGGPSESYTAILDAITLLTAADYAAINRNNAEKLFGS